MKKNIILYLVFIISYTSKAQQDVSSIYHWNEISTNAVINMGLPGNPNMIAPMRESRIYAMVYLSMHNIMNSIKPVSKTYHFDEKGFTNASLESAIAQSTYDILVHELPSQKDFLANAMNESLEKIPSGISKEQGITLGHMSAGAIIALRKNDNADKAMYPVDEGTKAGDYRYTPPFNGAPFNTPPFKGLIADPGWGTVTPFSISSAMSMRPALKPYPVNSKEYTKDFTEIKDMGCDQCPKRTKDQTVFAKFWMESSPRGWNRIAINIAKQKNISSNDLTRLLSLLHAAIADSYIVSMESKMYYFYWRPVTAIHLGDQDGNSKTPGDSHWKELGFPTPPIPDYPSAHANAGGAAAEVLSSFFKSDKIPFSTTSETLPGATRSFKSFSSAARENSLSRIYIGYHFRRAALIGEQVGKNIGQHIVNNLFK
ncbi:MAG: vanadium-dependent haloperoxidase [Saprospiraceae bacterium]